MPIFPIFYFPDFIFSAAAFIPAAFAAESLSVKLKFKSADPRSACIRILNLNFQLKLAHRYVAPLQFKRKVEV